MEMRAIEHCIAGALQDAKKETEIFPWVDENSADLKELFRSAAHCSFSGRLMRLPASRFVLRYSNIIWVGIAVVIGVCIGGWVGALLVCAADALPTWGYLQIGLGRMMFRHRLGERPIDTLVVCALVTASFFLLSGGFLVWKLIGRFFV